MTIEQFIGRSAAANAIASVLMLKPSILICDEIMSWIDDEEEK